MIPDVVEGLTAVKQGHEVRSRPRYRGLHLDKRHESCPLWWNVRNLDPPRLDASLNKAHPHSSVQEAGGFHNGCPLDSLGTWSKLLPWFSRGSIIALWART